MAKAKRQSKCKAVTKGTGDSCKVKLLSAAQKTKLSSRIGVARAALELAEQVAKRASARVATFVAQDRRVVQAQGSYGPSPCYAEQQRVGYAEAFVSQAEANLAYARAQLTLRKLELQACQGGVIV